jgi:hypothetical protein
MRLPTYLSSLPCGSPGVALGLPSPATQGLPSLLISPHRRRRTSPGKARAAAAAVGLCPCVDGRGTGQELRAWARAGEGDGVQTWAGSCGVLAAGHGRSRLEDGADPFIWILLRAGLDLQDSGRTFLLVAQELDWGHGQKGSAPSWSARFSADLGWMRCWLYWWLRGRKSVMMICVSCFSSGHVGPWSDGHEQDSLR